MLKYIVGGLTLVLAGVFMVYLGITGSLEDKAVKEHGVETIAAVVDKKEEVSRDSDGDDEETYWLFLKFYDLHQKEHSTKRSVEESFFNNTKVGDTVPIKYLEDKPELLRLKQEVEGDPMFLAYALGAMGVLTAGCGGFIIYAGRKQRVGQVQPAEPMKRAS